jgi:hypothetical protein
MMGVRGLDFRENLLAARQRAQTDIVISGGDGSGCVCSKIISAAGELLDESGAEMMPHR